MTRGPTLSEPITVSQWWKNRSGEAIRVTLSTYDGRNLIDVRVWRSFESGILKPSAKGIAADIKHLPKLTAAFRKAKAKARELQLIDSDDGVDQ